MDRGEIPTPLIPIQSIGWVREGRGLRFLGRGILVFCFITVAILDQFQRQMRRLSQWMKQVDLGFFSVTAYKLSQHIDSLEMSSTFGRVSRTFITDEGDKGLFLVSYFHGGTNRVLCLIFFFILFFLKFPGDADICLQYLEICYKISSNKRNLMMQGHPHFVKGGVLWVGLFNRLYRGLTLQRRVREIEPLYHRDAERRCRREIHLSL